MKFLTGFLAFTLLTFSFLVFAHSSAPPSSQWQFSDQGVQFCMQLTDGWVCSPLPADQLRLFLQHKEHDEKGVNNVDKQEILSRLEIRAKAFTSDPDTVTPDLLNFALNEALEIAGFNSDAPVIMDIAFYRFLLLVERNGVSEEQFKIYQAALKRVSDPSSPNAGVSVQARARDNPYV